MASRIALTIQGAGANSSLGKRLRSVLENEASLSRATEIHGDILANDWPQALSTGDRQTIDDCAARMLRSQGAVYQAVADAVLRAMAAEPQPEHTAPPAPLRVELVLPERLTIALAPSAGVQLEYDADGRVIGTRPRDSVQ